MMDKFTIINPHPSTRMVKNADVEKYFEGLKIIDRKDWKEGEAFLVKCSLSISIRFAMAMRHDEADMSEDPFKSTNA